MIINKNDKVYEDKQNNNIVESQLAISNNNEEISGLNEKKTYKYERKLIWHMIFIAVIVHLSAIYGFYLGYDNIYVNIFAKFLGIASNIAITGGAHRLYSHKSYKANYIVQSLLIFFSTVTYQHSVFTWARDHRMHHKYTETNADPHNSLRGFFFSHIGWGLVMKHPELKEKGTTIDVSDLKANPLVMFQHKYYYQLLFLCAILFPASFSYFVLGASWQVAIFTVVLYRIVFFLHFTLSINSFAHIYGHKPYNKNIGPTENVFVQLLGVGEGFHNYHHTFPYDYKGGEFRNDFRNATTLVIDMFAKLGWVTDRMTASKDAIDKKCARLGGSGRELDLYDADKKFNKNIQAFLFLAAVLIIF